MGLQPVFVVLIFFWENIMHLHFTSFLGSQHMRLLLWVVEIHDQVKQEYWATLYASWLLMIWRCKEPGHQQPLYWPRSPRISSLSPERSNVFRKIMRWSSVKWLSGWLTNTTQAEHNTDVIWVIKHLVFQVTLRSVQPAVWIYSEIKINIQTFAILLLSGKVISGLFYQGSSIQ